MSVYFASFLEGKQDPYEYRCEPYERVANETTTRHMRSLFGLTITTNALPLIKIGLRTASEYVANMRLYKF